MKRQKDLSKRLFGLKSDVLTNQTCGMTGGVPLSLVSVVGATPAPPVKRTNLAKTQEPQTAGLIKLGQHVLMARSHAQCQMHALHALNSRMGATSRVALITPNPNVRKGMTRTVTFTCGAAVDPFKLPAVPEDLKTGIFAWIVKQGSTKHQAVLLVILAWVVFLLSFFIFIFKWEM